MPKITYPESSASTISKALKDNGLEETEQDFFEMIKRGKRTNGEIVAAIVRKAAEQDMEYNDFVASIKQGLNTTQETADSIARVLRKQILVCLRKTEEKSEQIISEEQPKQVILEKKGPPRKDGYRESVE